MWIPPPLSPSGGGQGEEVKHILQIRLDGCIGYLVVLGKFSKHKFTFDGSASLDPSSVSAEYLFL